jgi:hypothetical protein
MPDQPSQPKPEVPRPAGVPKPPSEADLAQVGKDQALITDEWAAGEPSQDAPEDG